MEVEFIEIGNKIGFKDDDTYYPSEKCEEMLQDIISLLSGSDRILERYIAFYQSKIFSNDIIPLSCNINTEISVSKAKFSLVKIALKPISKLTVEEEDNNISGLYMKFCEMQQEIRQDLINSDIFNIIFKEFINNIKTINMTYLEILICLLVNLFDVSPFGRIMEDNKRSLRERMIEMFFSSNLHRIILYMTNCQNFNFELYILELLYNIFCHVEIYKMIFSKNDHNSLTSQSLNIIIKQEIQEKKLKTINKRTRHPRFGGTIIQQKENIIQTVCVSSNPYNKNLNDDSKKRNIKKSPKQLEIKEIEHFYRYNKDIENKIIEFSKEYLTYSFSIQNTKIIKNLFLKPNICNNRNYLWFIQYFLRSNRLLENNFRKIGDTVSITTFKIIFDIISESLDMLEVNKKQMREYLKPINYAVKCYYELYLFLEFARQNSDSKLNHLHMIISENIFYDGEHREILLRIFRKYRKDYFPYDFVVNLFLCSNLVINSSKTFSEIKGSFTVRICDNKKLKNKKNTKNCDWNIIDTGLREIDVLSLKKSMDINEFTEEPLEYFSEIKRYLVVGSFISAIKLYFKYCNELKIDIGESEDVINALKNIYINFEEEQNEITIENEPQYSEKVFDFDSYVRRFICLPVQKACSQIIQNYLKNDDDLNRKIFDFMKYVADELNFPQFFFHISFFRTFLQLFINESETPYNISSSVESVLNAFFIKASSDSRLFTDILFWKPMHNLTNIDDVKTDEYYNYDGKAISTTDQKSVKEKSDEVFEFFQIDDKNIQHNLFVKLYPSDIHRSKNEADKTPHNKMTNIDDFSEYNYILKNNFYRKSELKDNFAPYEEYTSSLPPKYAEDLIKIAQEMVKSGYLEVLSLITSFLSYVDELEINTDKRNNCPIELVPNNKIEKMLESPISVSFMNLCGFISPNNDKNDCWKIFSGNHKNIIQILNEIINNVS